MNVRQVCECYAFLRSGWTSAVHSAYIGNVASCGLCMWWATRAASLSSQTSSPAGADKLGGVWFITDLALGVSGNGLSAFESRLDPVLLSGVTLIPSEYGNNEERDISNPDPPSVCMDPRLCAFGDGQWNGSMIAPSIATVAGLLILLPTVGIEESYFCSSCSSYASGSPRSTGPLDWITFLLQNRYATMRPAIRRTPKVPPTAPPIKPYTKIDYSLMWNLGGAGRTYSLGWKRCVPG